MTQSILGRGWGRGWPAPTGALALMAACALTPAPAAGQAGISLSPHRAIYEMTLATTRGGSGVTAVSGRMVYELTGSACEGYTQNMRFVTQMTNQGGNAMITDLRSSSWEEGSGRRFRFSSSQFRDEKPTEATAGDAARANADDIKVELTKPAKKGLSLSARVYFPIQHSIALLQAAKDGQDRFPRRSLRRLGEGREGLRHGLHHRPAPAAGRQPAAAAREGRRARSTSWRRGRYRSATSSRAPTTATRCRSTSCRSCSSRTGSAASCSSTTASSPSAASSRRSPSSRRRSARRSDGAIPRLCNFGALAFLAKARFDCAHCPQKRRQMHIHGVPDDPAGDAAIVVAKDVADSRDVAPGDVGMLAS